MARRKKSAAEGTLIVLAVVIGAIVQALEAAGQFLRTHGDLIIGLVILCAVLWIAFNLLVWLFRAGKAAQTLPVDPGSNGVPTSPVRETSTPTSSSTRPLSVKPARDTALSCRWVPPGEAIHIHGFEIEEGMLYVGTGGTSPDASQIDPSLPIRMQNDRGYDTRQTYYWATYQNISPEARGAYLCWLDAGRCAPNADIGYVFLYFYGLERRVLLEPRSNETTSEIRLIEAELHRLLRIYGDNGSFRGYASSLLAYLESRQAAVTPRPEIPPEVERGGQIPFELRVGLAKYVVEQLPIPGSWAFAWWRAHPEARLRTPAERCPDEFRRLFIERYHQTHGAGLSLKENKTRLTLVHRPASPSLTGRVFESKLDLPDVTVLSGPMKKFATIAEGCYQTLDRYSRYLGRNPDKAAKIDALLELPVVLWPEPIRERLDELRSMVAGSELPGIILFEKVRQILPDWNSIGKASYTAFARVLGEFNIGIEPDSRFGGAIPSSSDRVVLFLDESSALNAASSMAYQIAALSLQLAVAVSLADGDIGIQEHDTLTRQLEEWLHLEAGERNRLKAHLRWLSVQSLGLAGLKKRIDALSPPAREALGDFLIRVAHADGEIAPSEVRLLEKLFKLLALDPATLYSKLHLAPSEPISVRLPAKGSHGFAIPDGPPEKRAGGLDLDFEKVSTLVEDSRRISDALHAIFVDSSQDLSPEPDEETTDDDAAKTGDCVWGLSPGFSEFVRLLATRPEWSRTELEELAADRSLMLDGALEHINDAAFDRFDQPLTEGDDPLEINQELIAELAI